MEVTELCSVVNNILGVDFQGATDRFSVLLENDTHQETSASVNAAMLNVEFSVGAVQGKSIDTVLSDLRGAITCCNEALDRIRDLEEQVDGHFSEILNSSLSVTEVAERQNIKVVIDPDDPDDPGDPEPTGCSDRTGPKPNLPPEGSAEKGDNWEEF